MVEMKDETGIAILVEGALAKVREANEDVARASLAVAAAGAMLAYASAEMTKPPVTGLGNPIVQAFRRLANRVYRFDV